MKENGQQLEIILDQCVTAVIDEGQSVNACLAQYPAQQEALEPLLQLSVRLRAAGTLQPSPEFRQVAALRMQHLLAANPPRQPSGSPPTVRLWNWRTLFKVRRGSTWVGLAGLALVVCLLFGSITVSAAVGTIPGDALYPVKRLGEQTQVTVTQSELTKARLHLRFADRRLAEAAALVATNQESLAIEAITAFAAEIDQAVVTLTQPDLLTTTEQKLLAEWIANDLAVYERDLALWQEAVSDEMDTAVFAARTTSEAGKNAAYMVLGMPTAVPVPAASATPTNSATATQSPIPTSTPTPTWTKTAVPSGTPLPTTTTPPHAGTATPGSLPPHWPTNCPPPAGGAVTWPAKCALPIGWPTSYPTIVGSIPAISGTIPAIPTLPTVWPTITIQIPSTIPSIPTIFPTLANTPVPPAMPTQPIVPTAPNTPAPPPTIPTPPVFPTMPPFPTFPPFPQP